MVSFLKADNAKADTVAAAKADTVAAAKADTVAAAKADTVAAAKADTVDAAKADTVVLEGSVAPREGKLCKLQVGQRRPPGRGSSASSSSKDGQQLS